MFSGSEYGKEKGNYKVRHLTFFSISAYFMNGNT